MNQNRIKQSGAGAIVIIVAVIVVIGVIALLWWAFARSNETTDNDQTQETTEPLTITGTYFDAVSNGRALQCDWTVDYEGEVMVPKGTLYTDGANRGLSEATTVGANPKQTYTLVDEQHVYNWVVGGSSTLATKVDRGNVENLPFDEALIDDSQSIDLNAPYIFDCEAWTVDESKLTPPSDVQFVDLTRQEGA